MQSVGKLIKFSARRPYWLLLALILYIAAQVAAVSHWHNDAVGLDADCSLCVMSSATAAAIAADALDLASTAFALFVLFFIAPRVIAQFLHFYDSRAPPLHS